MTLGVRPSLGTKVKSPDSRTSFSPTSYPSQPAGMDAGMDAGVAATGKRLAPEIQSLVEATKINQQRRPLEERLKSRGGVEAGAVDGQCPPPTLCTFFG